MLRKILRAKIHRATVTQRDIDYVGSLSLDADLMDACGLAGWECVTVADVDNGSRHETYVIPAERGSGMVCVNGAAAHLVNVGDKVIIMCYGYMDDSELARHRPGIVLVDERNHLVKTL
jgi:aspartate 1-decarboxylase